jgi:hypothetical protein
MSLFSKIRLAWVAVCVLAFLACVPTYNTTTCRDNDILLGLVMFGLSSPASYFIADHTPGILNLPEAGRLGMSIDWLFCFAIGYLQWFVIVPFCLRLVCKLWSRLKSAVMRRYCEMPDKTEQHFTALNLKK